MEKKFTPGPWEAFTEDSFAGWWAVRQVETGGEVGSGDGGDSEADARMKAAAPELFKALKGMLYWFGAYTEFVPHPDTIESYKQTIAQSHKALAKALGSAPSDE